MTNLSVDEKMLNQLKGFCAKGAKFNSPGNVPTGHFELDFAIQYGMSPRDVDLQNLKGYDPSVPLGLPLGKLVEIFGMEGGGKSSLAYRVVGYAQKMGYPTGWIDTENSFSDNLANINGCDLDEIWLSDLSNVVDPDKFFHAEDVMDQIQIWCKAGIKVVVLDSVANLVPKARGEAKSEQQFMGLLPRLLSENLGKIVGYAAKYGVLLIFINQLREKIGQMWGNPETSPGGHSLKHNASVRLKVSKKSGKDMDIMMVDEETGEEKLIGRRAGVRIEKNRLAKPFLTTLEVPIYYEPYFPEIEDIVFDTGRQTKLISVRNKVYNWDGLKVEGRKGFIEEIKQKSLLDKLIADVKSKAFEVNMLLPPEITQYEENKDDLQIQGSGSTKDSPGGKTKSKKSTRSKSSKVS